MKNKVVHLFSINKNTGRSLFCGRLEKADSLVTFNLKNVTCKNCKRKGKR